MLVMTYWNGASVPKPGSLAKMCVTGLPKDTFWATAVMSDMSASAGVAVTWMLCGVVDDCAATEWFMKSKFLQARYAALLPLRTSRASGVTVAEVPDMDALLLLKARWLIVVYVVPVVFI